MANYGLFPVPVRIVLHPGTDIDSLRKYVEENFENVVVDTRGLRYRNNSFVSMAMGPVQYEELGGTLEYALCRYRQKPSGVWAQHYIWKDRDVVSVPSHLEHLVKKICIPGHLHPA